MLVQTIEQEGATVEWQRPDEQPGVGQMAQEVIVQMVATGSVTAIAAAVARFDKHLHGRAEVSIPAPLRSAGMLSLAHSPPIFG